MCPAKSEVAIYSRGNTISIAWYASKVLMLSEMQREAGFAKLNSLDSHEWWKQPALLSSM